MAIDSPPRLRTILFVAAAVVLGLALVEGLASLGLLLVDLGADRRPLAERSHTRYDPELGWVNEPSKRVPDLYGPGRTLTINSAGFRALREYAPTVPPGKVRVLCSGDSFTLGWGVDDVDTWCANLEGRDTRLEVVNMGQGGYGVDQAYLWARRDGPTLEHQLHLFAVISGDLDRMRYDRFEGYGKPVLELADGVPVAGRVPVPRRAFWIPALARSSEWISELRTVQALRRIGGITSEAKTQPVLRMSEAVDLAVRALEVLSQEDGERGGRLVVVWLPTVFELVPGPNDALRKAFLGGVRSAGIPVINLTEDFRRLSPERADALFQIQEGLSFPVGGRHYSVAGNEFVAHALWERLRRMPPLSGAD